MILASPPLPPQQPPSKLNTQHTQHIHTTLNKQTNTLSPNPIQEHCIGLGLVPLYPPHNIQTPFNNHHHYERVDRYTQPYQYRINC